VSKGVSGESEGPVKECRREDELNNEFRTSLPGLYYRDIFFVSLVGVITTTSALLIEDNNHHRLWSPEPTIIKTFHPLIQETGLLATQFINLFDIGLRTVTGI